jgi:hypothetical protein
VAQYIGVSEIFFAFEGWGVKIVLSDKLFVGAKSAWEWRILVIPTT